MWSKFLRMHACAWVEGVQFSGGEISPILFDKERKGFARTGWLSTGYSMCVRFAICLACLPEASPKMHQNGITRMGKRRHHGVHDSAVKAPIPGKKLKGPSFEMYLIDMMKLSKTGCFDGREGWTKRISHDMFLCFSRSRP